MKIAFVGKGGAGKSTLCALYCRYLVGKSQIVWALDADINMHLAELLSVVHKPELALSASTNQEIIRAHLKGENRRIKSPAHFLATTPPGSGSRLLHFSPMDAILERYSVPFAPSGRISHVGTYDSEGIGKSCYHANLFIAENLLAHSVLESGQWIVVDMTAGTDAFSYSLHAQFDLLVLVVEPTPEGVSVFNQYVKLGKSSGVLDCIQVVGNKVEDQADLEYLKNNIGDKLIGVMPYSKSLRKLRQSGQALHAEERSDLFSVIEQRALSTQYSPDAKLQQLYQLHRNLAQETWVTASYGNIEEQIDKDFCYPMQASVNKDSIRE